MDICLMGTGYVGLVTGTCLAHAGHQVTCLDKDPEKIFRLCQGVMPIFEPDLEELVRENIALGSLKFSTNPEQAIKNAFIIYIAVGTPQSPDGRADLSQIKEVAALIGRYINEYKIVVIKSTVPVGTGSLVSGMIKSEQKTPIPFDVVSNPEFLRQGSAVYDTFHMDRAIIGANTPRAGEVVAQLCSSFTHNILLTDVNTAEMIKYASNAFLATKVTFINQIANICEKVGADVTQVAEGMGMDPRIGRAFLQAGVGYGGSCFPKDTMALIKIAEEAGYDFNLLQEVIKANESQPLRVVSKLRSALQGLEGKKIAVLGLTFKPNTDDLRSAPSLAIIKALLQEGCQVKAYDPVADKIRLSCFPQVPISGELYQTLAGCDGAVILTEWEQIKDMDLVQVKGCLQNPVLVDGRNIFSPQEMRNLGFTYLSIGRQ